MARLQPQWMAAGTYSAAQDRRLIGAMWPRAAVSGMSAAVQAGTMTVLVQWGNAVVPDTRTIGTSYLCSSDGSEVVPIPAADPQDRIDLVVVRPRDAIYGGADNDWIYDVIGGAPGASPVVPAVPANTAPIFQILVRGGNAFLTATDLVDRRGAMMAAESEPPTTSNVVVSRVDHDGEVWVARAGVNGGAWRRARDVLHCSHRRVAALNLSAGSAALFSHETAVHDAYGLYAPAGSALVVPVGGVWRFDQIIVATATAANQWVQSQLNVNNALGQLNQATTGGAGSFGVSTFLSRRLNAGDSVTTLACASIALAAVVVGGGPWCQMVASYLGA
jgi:hypothetical protein